MSLFIGAILFVLISRSAAEGKKGKGRRSFPRLLFSSSQSTLTIRLEDEGKTMKSIRKWICSYQQLEMFQLHENVQIYLKTHLFIDWANWNINKMRLSPLLSLVIYGSSKTIIDFILHRLIVNIRWWNVSVVVPSIRFPAQFFLHSSTFDRLRHKAFQTFVDHVHRRPRRFSPFDLRVSPRTTKIHQRRSFGQ